MSDSADALEVNHLQSTERLSEFSNADRWLQNENLADAFPILTMPPSKRTDDSKKTSPVCHFDNASTSHKPQVVIDTLLDFYQRQNANVHRGLYPLSAEATESFEQARETVADFVGVDPRSLIFTTGTTAGLNLLAHGLSSQIQSGDVILVTDLEHHSNLIPWMQLCERRGARLRSVPIDRFGELDLEFLENTLKTERVRVFTTTGLSHVLGNVTSFEKAFRFARAHGVFCILDGAQMGLGLEGIMKDETIDAVAFSAHKVHGPFGVGALALSPRLAEKLEPVSTGGGMVLKIPDSMTYQEISWNLLPYRLEAGTPPVAEAIAFAEAIRFMQTDLYRKAAAGHHAIDTIAQALSATPGVRLYGWASALSPRDPLKNSKSDMDEQRKTIPHGAVLSFTLEGEHPHDVAQALADEGISVRAGFHCAQPLMKKLGQLHKSPNSSSEQHSHDVSFGTVRVSLSPAIRKSEVMHFLSVLQKLTRQEGQTSERLSATATLTLTSTSTAASTAASTATSTATSGLSETREL